MASPNTLNASPPSSASAARPRSLRVGVIGANGTSGAELVRLLAEHPQVRLQFATSRSAAGQPLDEIEPAAPPLRLIDSDTAPLDEADVLFLCVPHGTAGPLVAQSLAAGARVIDVSGDHRLRDAARHAAVYASPREQSLADEAVYGLPEFHRAAISRARLVANPGCYATAMALALAPLAEAGRLEQSPVVDAKSGVSGAGRGGSATTHFCSVAEDVRAYKPGRAHRHLAEVEQLLQECDPQAAPVIFTPHLVPIERGIEATVVVRGAGLNEAVVRQIYQDRYGSEAFVRLLPPGRTARTRATARSNRADLGVSPIDGLDGAVVTCSLDNLVKGAGGQAIQNMNLMAGLPETLGLPGAQLLTRDQG